MQNDPNSFDQEIKDAQNGANPATPNQGTEPVAPVTDPAPEGEQVIDYKNKFAESSKEALRLLEETKRLQDELEAKANAPVATPEPAMESIYPGFEQLDPEAQQNLINYTNVITNRAKAEIYRDPAIVHAKAVYNESKFDQAFMEIASAYPQLAQSKDEFKSKYFNANNTPDNIKTILSDVAKIYLFDKAKDIGASEERAKKDRIDLERTTAGEKTPSVGRSLEDWGRMAQENPVKFAQLHKEYNADLESGKLKE
jgi:hypothetical protein